MTTVPEMTAHDAAYVAAVDRLQVIADQAYARWPKGGDFADFLKVLTPTERGIVMVGKLAQQVTNGGWLQWVDNKYAVDLPQLYMALGRIGTPAATETARLVELVEPLIEAINAPQYDDEGGEWDGVIDLLDEYDREFYKIDEQLIIDAAIVWTKVEVVA